MENQIPEEHLQRAAELLEYFNNVDPFVDIILKAHLKIESMLDEIIKTFVFNQQYIDDSKLSFYQKTKIAQAICKKSSDVIFWDVILLLNTMRNDTAHTIENAKRNAQLVKLGELMAEDVKDYEVLSDVEKIIFTSAPVIGFLNAFLEDLKQLNEIRA